jgi:pyruvate, water dikinase
MKSKNQLTKGAYFQEKGAAWFKANPLSSRASDQREGSVERSMDTPKTRLTNHHPRLVMPITSPCPRSEAAIRYQSVLAPYDEAMDLMAEFELIEHTNDAVDMDAIKRLYDRLQLAVQKMIVALGDLGDHRSGDLLKIHQHFDRQTAPLFGPALSLPSHPILVSLEDIHPDMAPFVGHKAAHLAAIGNSIGLPVPQGFVLTAKAFDRFLEDNELPGVIDAYLRDLTVEHAECIDERCEAIRRLILQAPVPSDIEDAIRNKLDRWREHQGGFIFTAVRSTAIGEDSEVSFAGQFATLLNVPAKSVIAAYKEVLASKYNPGAILYRMRYGMDDRTTPMAVIVMAMVSSQASGVMYTRNPSRPEQADLQISAIRGLGEYLMSGDTAPHVLSVCRRTGRITTRHAAQQSHWITTRPEGGTCLAPIPREDQVHPPIDDATARCLADWGERLEKHFGGPQDVEWAIDAAQHLYLLQSRSLGLDGPPPSEPIDVLPLERLPVIHAGGRKACSGIVAGRIYHAGQTHSETIPADSILVIPKAAPEYAPTVARVRGVIAVKGSAASHLASVAREFGVPMIVNTGPDDGRWIQGQWVTLYADKVTVYAGRIPAIDGRPSQSPSDPFESPVRRRLRALSNRITHCHRPSPDETTPLPYHVHTLHDLLRLAYRFAMETLHTHRLETENAIQVIHWAEDNVANDFNIQSTINPPSPAHPIGELFLQALWDGLSWSPQNTTASQRFGIDGYALIADNSMHVTIPFESQQSIIDVCRPPNHNADQIRLRVVGGTGPYYKRCLRTRFLAEILEGIGLSIRINGALLEASVTSGALENSRDLLRQIGRLLNFSRGMDSALVGPWALKALRSTFMTSDVLSPSPKADLPASFFALSGNWRQATLNRRSVVVQDGAAVTDTPMPPLQQLVGNKSGTYQTFLKQLYQDHFFPLAIAKASQIKDGQIDLAINLLTGKQACAGGLVFGYRDTGHHFMLGLDAHHERIILYEFIHGRRFKRLRKRYPVDTDRWYDITLRISGLSMHIQLNGVPVMAYTAERPVGGQVGMWAWADTVIVFDRLALMSGTRQEIAF